MANTQPSGEVVGWFHAARDDETYHLLGKLGFESDGDGVYVVREGHRVIGWQIDDYTGYTTPEPENVRFEKKGPIFSPRDIDRDRELHRAWTYDGHYPYTMDLPWDYDYESAVKERAGLQFYIVAGGLHRAARQTNFNPTHYDMPKHMVKLIEVMLFSGPPPVDAASLYSGE